MYPTGESHCRYRFLTEFYDSDFAHLSLKLFKSTHQPHKKNINSDKLASRLPVDEAFLMKVEEHHAKDLHLYKWALAQRNTNQGMNC